MPIVCIRRPNRTNPRGYTENDLSRIATYVHDSGVPWTAIIAVVAVSGGIGYLFCRIVRFLDMVEDMREWVVDLIDVSTAAAAIATAIGVLRYGTGIPGLRRIVIGLIAILAATLAFLRKIERYKSELRDAEAVSGARQAALDVCAAVELRVNQLRGEGKEDKLSDEDRETFIGDLPPL